jgi:hypothetical protein
MTDSRTQHIGANPLVPLDPWKLVDEVTLDQADDGTYAMRRTKANLMYQRAKSLRRLIPFGTPSLIGQ